MISLFRHHLQGRFLRYVIYAVSFFIIFPSAFFVVIKWFDAGDWVIKVNGKPIEVLSYQSRISEVSRQIERIKQLFGDYADTFLSTQGLADPEKAAAESLIVQKLLDEVAHKLHITLSPVFIQQQLIKMLPKEVVLPDGSIDWQRLAQAYNTSPLQLEEQLHEQLISNLLMELTEGALFLPSFLLKDKFIQLYSERSFLIAHLSLASLVKEEESKKSVSDEELKKFFESENRKNKRYFVPEKRAGVIWKFIPDSYQAKISEKQVEHYYNKNKYKEFIDEPAQLQVRRILMHFNDKNRSEIRSKMIDLRKELEQDPKLFEQKARELSEDTTTNKKGGLTGFFARGKHDKEFDQVAFRLQKDGDISPLIETKDGFELLQRESRKSQTFKSLASVKNDIAKKLRANQFERFFQHDVHRALAQEDKRSALEKFAKNKGGKKEVVDLTVMGNEPYMKRFFSVRKGSGGSVSNTHEGFAFFVTEINKAFQPAFTDIVKEVRVDWYKEQAKKQLKKLLIEAEKIRSKEQFLEFAHKHKAIVETTGKISQQMQDKAQQVLQKLGTTAEKLFVLSIPDRVITFDNGTNGYLVCLEEIDSFNEKRFEEEKNSIKKTLYEEQKSLVERSFVASLFKNSKIDINKKIATVFK